MFFKIEPDSGDLLIGPNYVLNMNYELYAETHDEHTYPVDGWYWFETIEDACAAFEIPVPPEEL